jgi:hypothetical protein
MFLTGVPVQPGTAPGELPLRKKHLSPCALHEFVSVVITIAKKANVWSAQLKTKESEAAPRSTASVR